MTHAHHENAAFETHGRRITNEDARKMLGMIGRNYSDEEIAEILDGLYGFAEEAFEDYHAASRDVEPGSDETLPGESPESPS